MAETNYIYSIATDTANAAVIGRTLQNEIEASAIVTAVERIDTSGDVLDVVMKDIISAGDQTILDAIVAAHTGIQSAPPVQKMKIVHSEVESLTLLIEGFSGLATLDDDTNIDFTLTEGREVEGASLFVYDHNPGDYVQVEFWEPVTPSKVKSYGKNVYIPPSGEVFEIRGDETSAIPSGFIMRIIYTSTATTGPQPRIGCNVRWQH